MRQDMQKCCVERGRVNRAYANSLKTHKRLNPNFDWVDVDTGPSHISSARRRNWEHKSLGHTFASLENFLESSVGRKWNDIYSEVCAAPNSRKSIGGQNLVRALSWSVELHVRIINDVPHYLPSGRWYRNGRELNGLYVDPDDGILKRHDASWRHREPKVRLIDEIIVDPLLRYQLENNFWYKLTYSYHDPSEVYQEYKFENCCLPVDLRAKYGLNAPGDRYIVRYKDFPERNRPYLVKKEQCSKRETQYIQKHYLS